MVNQSHLEKSFYWQSCDGIFSPWIFFPADLARRLLTCKFFHLQIWHGTFQGCQMHRKTKMIKPKFKSKLKSSKQPWNPLRPKPKYHIPSKTSKFCWKTTKWCENHQKQIRNALQPNCTTINAIIVTNTTKYGSVHRSGTLHHKPSCKNTEMTSISTKYLLENAEVTKNKNDQSNPKNGGQTPKPPMPLAARHWFQRVQNPDPNKIHSASKSCSKPKPSTKRVVKFTKSTHMINGVLLLGFQCPNAQTLATWLTACLKHGWIIVSIKTQAKK